MARWNTGRIVFRNSVIISWAFFHRSELSHSQIAPMKVGKSHLKCLRSQEILFEINCLHTLADICGFYENSLTLYKFHDDLLQKCLQCQSSLGRLKLARGQTEGGWKYLTNKNSWVTFLHLKGNLYLQYFYFCIKVLQNVLEFHIEHCQRGKQNDLISNWFFAPQKKCWLETLLKVMPLLSVTPLPNSGRSCRWNLSRI